jgi:hypothetical protein
MQTSPKSEGIAELEAQVRAMRERQRALAELQVVVEDARQVDLPFITAVMEHNLGRKGIWAADPNRKQQEWTYTTEDVVGSLTVTYSLGQLSTFEMELVAWILGRWEKEQPEDGRITFTLRECAREFGSSWGGTRGEFVKSALYRIDGTRFRGRVYYAPAKRREERTFGILDSVHIVERANGLNGSATEPGTVTVKLSDFLQEQLRRKQFARLDWRALREGIRTPLAKRLYVFLEGQKGFPAGPGLVSYETEVDGHLIESLGCRDRNLPRLRAKLEKAGEEIQGVDARYREITMRAGKRRGAYVLRAVREEAGSE